MATDYRTMIEAAPEAIIVYTPQKFLFLNEFAARRLGSDPASLVGQPIMELSPKRWRVCTATMPARTPTSWLFISRARTRHRWDGKR